MSGTPGRILDTNPVPLPSTPPSNVDAEKAVLGSMILDPTAIETVAPLLKAHSFFSDRNRLIYEAILDLNERGVAADFTTVVDELTRRRMIEKAGGAAYVTSLEQHVFSTANAEHHAKIVQAKYQLRELADIAQTIRHEALTEQDDVGVLLDLAEKRIFDLSEQRTTRDFQDIGSLTIQTIDEIDRRASSTSELSGVETGYADLDEWTGGLQKSDLLILAARPSVGKTAFALNMAANIGAGLKNRQLHPEKARCVGVFSLEMSAPQINMRLLSTITEVPMHIMRTGRLTSRDKQRLHTMARQLHGLPIYIDDTPSLSILELRAKARRLAAMRPDLSLIMIDYLQLMRGGGRVENRQQEISEISRSLKALARELNVPIMALSQLSRLIEQRKGKNSRPILSDLRESGAIEQDADVVMFLHREKSYDRKDEDDDEQAKGAITAEKAELIIGKQRNGPIGIIDLVFFRETATYHSLAKNFNEEGPGF